MAPNSPKNRAQEALLASILAAIGGQAYVGNAQAERIDAQAERIADELESIGAQVSGLRESMAGATARDAEHDRRLNGAEVRIDRLEQLARRK